jgi:hypothetical protein
MMGVIFYLSFFGWMNAKKGRYVYHAPVIDRQFSSHIKVYRAQPVYFRYE